MSDDKKKSAVKAVKTLKELLYDGMLRKNAFKQVCRDWGIDRSTLYRYCIRFGVRIR